MMAYRNDNQYGGAVVGRWAWCAALIGCAVTPMLQAADAGLAFRLSVTDTTSYYDVSAANAAELAQQLRVGEHINGSNSDSSALTLSKLRLTPRLVLSDGECRVVSADIELAVQMVLPRWADAEPVPPPMALLWKRTARLVAEHEDAHRDNAVEAAEDLRRELQQMGSRSDCRVMNIAVTRLLAKHQQHRALRDLVLDRRYIEVQGDDRRARLRRDASWLHR